MSQRVVSMVAQVVQTILRHHVKDHGIALASWNRNSGKHLGNGAVAQSAERLNGIQEVAGAKPASSTKSPQAESEPADYQCTNMDDCTCPRCAYRASGPALGASVECLLAAKAAANLRTTYLRSLRQYLNMFARWRGPGTPLHEITVEDLDRWFSSRKEAPSSISSNIGRLSSLFSFAVRRRWLMHNPCDQLERPRLDGKTPRVLTPDDARKVLTVCRQRWPRFLPALVLMTFCGVRPAEVQRLRWGAVDVEARVVHIDGSVSKVRARRVVRLRPNAVEWLRLGGDLPCLSHRRHMRRLSRELGWWTPDVLRHSAASYLLSIDQDIGKVATQLGNSPAILARHYLHLVTPADAAAFWNLFP